MENVPAFIARTQQTEVNRVLHLFDRLFHLGPSAELLFHDASWTGDAAVRVCRLWTNLFLPELWELYKSEQWANDVRTAQAWVESYSPALSTVPIGPRTTSSRAGEVNHLRPELGITRVQLLPKLMADPNTYSQQIVYH